MKKLKAFTIILLCFVAIAFTLPQEHVFAQDITTTTAEEITTTTATTEEITTTTEELTTTETTEEATDTTETTAPPIDWESELNIRLELAKSYVIAALTSVIGIGVVSQLAKLLIDKAIKALNKKVEEAKQANVISQDQADKLTASLQVAQVTANAKIDSLAEDLERQRAEFEALNGNISFLLAELQERDRLLGILLDQTLGNDGEPDGEE